MCVLQGLAGEVIFLRVRFQNGFFRLHLSNMHRSEAFAGTVLGCGRGLGIIGQVVEKYEGRLRICSSGSVFLLSALLQEPLIQNGIKEKTNEAILKKR